MSNKERLHQMINHCREVAEHTVDPATYLALVMPCVIAMSKSMERDAARIAELQAALREANKVIEELSESNATARDTRGDR